MPVDEESNMVQVAKIKKIPNQNSSGKRESTNDEYLIASQEPTAPSASRLSKLSLNEGGQSMVLLILIVGQTVLLERIVTARTLC